MCGLSWNLGASTFWNPQGLSRPVMGLLFLYLYVVVRISSECFERRPVICTGQVCGYRNLEDIREMCGMIRGRKVLYYCSREEPWTRCGSLITEIMLCVLTTGSTQRVLHCVWSSVSLHFLTSRPSSGRVHLMSRLLTLYFSFNRVFQKTITALNMTKSVSGTKFRNIYSKAGARKRWKHSAVNWWVRKAWTAPVRRWGVFLNFLPE